MNKEIDKFIFNFLSKFTFNQLLIIIFILFTLLGLAFGFILGSINERDKILTNLKEKSNNIDNLFRIENNIYSINKVNLNNSLEYYLYIENRSKI